MLRNIGAFSVSHRFFHDLRPWDGVNLFNGMLVLSAIPNPRSSATDYVAIHEDFEPVEIGMAAPLYNATFPRNCTYPVWVKVD